MSVLQQWYRLPRWTGPWELCIPSTPRATWVHQWHPIDLLMWWRSVPRRLLQEWPRQHWLWQRIFAVLIPPLAWKRPSDFTPVYPWMVAMHKMLEGWQLVRWQLDLMVWCLHAMPGLFWLRRKTMASRSTLTLAHHLGRWGNSQKTGWKIHHLKMYCVLEFRWISSSPKSPTHSGFWNYSKICKICRAELRSSPLSKIWFMKLPTTRDEKSPAEKTLPTFPLTKKRSIALNVTAFVAVSTQLPQPGFCAGWHWTNCWLRWMVLKTTQVQCTKSVAGVFLIGRWFSRTAGPMKT